MTGCLKAKLDSPLARDNTVPLAYPSTIHLALKANKENWNRNLVEHNFASRDLINAKYQKREALIQAALIKSTEHFARNQKSLA